MKYIVMCDFYSSAYKLGDILEVHEHEDIVHISPYNIKQSKEQWNTDKDMCSIQLVNNANIHLVQKRLMSRINELDKYVQE